jgi:hypothetical protein
MLNHALRPHSKPTLFSYVVIELVDAVTIGTASYSTEFPFSFLMTNVRNK